MSLSYVTKCDCCGLTTEGWDENEGMSNWVTFTEGNRTFSGKRMDYCPKCWEKLKKAAEMFGTKEA